MRSLFDEIFIKDIAERYRIKYPAILKDISHFLCSNIGSLTNSTKLAKSIRSSKKIKMTSETSVPYLKDEEKRHAELRPLLAISDSFQKIILSNSYGKTWINDKKIIHMSIIDFLLGNADSVVFKTVEL